MSAVTEVGGTPVPDLPDVFGEFCAAGLWPGLGRAMAAQLAGAGITGPALVTAERLELIDGVSGERAARLAAAFHDARPCYETAQLLAACRVPARFAGPAVAMLGRTAPGQLREDPWRLLALPQIRPDQADWFARKLLGGQASPQDPRRGRALVSYLLTRAARDGHTAVPAGVIAGALARFRIEDPAAAIAAAVDEGGVLPFEADPGEDPGRAGDESAGEDGEEGEDGRGDGEEATAGILLALARYAMAEETVAEGLQRLAALAGPLDVTDTGPAADPGPSSGPDAAPAASLDAAQQAAVRAVAGHGVSVLTGGPGTGKSRTVAAVVAMAADAWPGRGPGRPDRAGRETTGGTHRRPGHDRAPAARGAGRRSAAGGRRAGRAPRRPRCRGGPPGRGG